MGKSYFRMRISLLVVASDDEGGMLLSLDDKTVGISLGGSSHWYPPPSLMLLLLSVFAVEVVCPLMLLLLLLSCTPVPFVDVADVFGVVAVKKPSMPEDAGGFLIESTKMLVFVIKLRSLARFSENAA